MSWGDSGFARPMKELAYKFKGLGPSLSGCRAMQTNVYDDSVAIAQLHTRIILIYHAIILTATYNVAVT